ncbi:hypothetical protein [Bradyrhizobium erythrophlei]|jgi:hypothetical protein|uniref:Uncharacterized protein n=1 Tax=Bradyrhizobium erythrophlei TaxID=1437360 RepID=A0A1M5NGW6_9BRAD|nr:hypothetical protein [Bradyrhizobium erythrophlei]SHG88675.1 hypothetical protein SAMN05443248_2989 [Bradyrhizobium erythrophlei]
MADTINVPNLDCLDQSELRELAKHLLALSRYASQKAHAMDLRSSGKIKLALYAEEILDKRYQALPTEWRW